MEFIEPNFYPLISVIIPVFNGEKFIKNLLEHLNTQQYRNFEIIVVDDGSTDNTAKIIQNFTNVSYTYQENAGPAAARNSGLKLAKGVFIAFLDCDDLWPETHLASLIEHFKSNDELNIVEGLIQELILKNKQFEAEELPHFNCSLGSCIIRKSTFDTIGCFDEELLYCEDVDWFTRAWENNVLKKRIPAISLYCRRHENNMTLDLTRRYRYRMLFYKKKIEREKSTVYNKELIRPIPLKDYLN